MKLANRTKSKLACLGLGIHIVKSVQSNPDVVCGAASAHRPENLKAIA